jgi:glycosyltransferase involved in cell wall biosynthesis
MKPKLLFVVNVDWFFISHRLPIALEAMKAGYEVNLAMAYSGHKEYLVNLGFIVHEIPFSRAGHSIGREMKTFLCLFKLLRSLRPDIIHTVTIKPSLYAGLVARLLGIKNLVVAISGLGLVFVDKGWFASIRKSLVKLLYKSAIDSKYTKLVFQNMSDYETLREFVKFDSKNHYLIKGSGVDLTEFSYTEPPAGDKFIVSLAARLLKEKGIYDFIAAAEIVRETEYSDLISFRLIGEPDLQNPNSVLPEEWDEWRESGIVDCLGFRSDVNKLFSATNIVVFPSYYGEGLPKVLIEAAACGRAVITSDSPGCRDAVLDGETGVIVPVKDPLALSQAILMFAENRGLAEKMGKAGREFANMTFSLDSVVSLHMKIYKGILDSSHH